MSFFFQNATHGLVRDALYFTQADQAVGQELHRPAFASFRWCAFAQGNQQGFILAAQLGFGSRTSSFVQCEFEVSLHEPFARPVYCRLTSVQCGCNVGI